MSALKSGNFIPRRRRHDDDEEDASTAADGDVSSQGSRSSDNEEEDYLAPPFKGSVSSKTVSPETARVNIATSNGVGSKEDSKDRAAPQAVGTKVESSAGMMDQEEVLDFERTQEVSAPPRSQPHSQLDLNGRLPVRTIPTHPRAAQHNYSSDRGRRGISGNIVPSRAPITYYRGSRNGALPTALSKPWSHDLHESVNTTQAQSQPIRKSGTAPNNAPNRNFSFVTVLGNVPVYLHLPFQEKDKGPYTVPKKHHVLLPEHRPPMRRDKPVRVSLPEVAPFCIFPSQERSFVFIPRALRPPQQLYKRGRTSIHGSRRGSTYNDSAYTPSVAMSRRSSFGHVPSGLRTPVSVMSGHAMLNSQPSFQMPLAGPAVIQPAPQTFQTPHYAGSFRYNHSYDPGTVQYVATAPTQVPMHHTIHEQAPPPPPPLMHIPEGAVYAQEFQPQTGFMPPYYQPLAPRYPMQMNGTIFYPGPYSQYPPHLVPPPQPYPFPQQQQQQQMFY